MEKGFLNSPTDANSISMANTNAAGSNGRNNTPSYTYPGAPSAMPNKPCGCGGPKAIQPPPMNNRQPSAPQMPQSAYPQPANYPVEPYRPTPKL